MKSKVLKFKAMLFFRLSTILQAVGYGVITYYLIYRLIARGDALVTYLLNILVIIIMLYIDGLAHKFAAKKAHDIREVYASMGIVLRALFLLGQGFTRTALYLFYICVLVLSRVRILRPELIPFEIGSFFISIEFGIILLFAVDKLKELLIKDKKWFDKNLCLEDFDEKN